MSVREFSWFMRDCQFDSFIKLVKGRRKIRWSHCDTIHVMSAFWVPPLDKDLLTAKILIYQVMIPKVEAGDFEMTKDYKTHPRNCFK